MAEHGLVDSPELRRYVEPDPQTQTMYIVDQHLQLSAAERQMLQKITGGRMVPLESDAPFTSEESGLEAMDMEFFHALGPVAGTRKRRGSALTSMRNMIGWITSPSPARSNCSSSADMRTSPRSIRGAGSPIRCSGSRSLRKRRQPRGAGIGAGCGGIAGSVKRLTPRRWFGVQKSKSLPP